MSSGLLNSATAFCVISLLVKLVLQFIEKGPTGTSVECFRLGNVALTETDSLTNLVANLATWVFLRQYGVEVWILCECTSRVVHNTVVVVRQSK